MKFFLLLVLFFVVVWLFRGGRRRGERGTPLQSSVAPSDDAQSSSESIVACIRCGLHLPQGEAVSGDAGWFCDDAHRVAHDINKPR